ncbi:MAG TPA: molybdopterin-dependent oxidoreductase, partial [Casimicrobiaceae bacterium]|nr:molybdopterin-dependent oxidoreductase [Casimicrobiaceae bacterium]
MSSPDGIAFELDGREVLARPGETLLAVADREGVEIPRLCHLDGYRPDGNCRACVVEIAGERALAPACCRVPTPGMRVAATTERPRHAQRIVVELLLADVHDDAVAHPYRHDSELARWARSLGLSRSRFPARGDAPAPDVSHPAIDVRLDACIQCGRCVRACREEQVNDVIGMAWRGDRALPVFDAGDPLGASTCVACGECVQACPTGALAPAGDVAREAPERSVDSLCPYCGVGCQVRYHVRNGAIASAEGRDGPANHARLCVKGRFGFDYARHPQRLDRPLVRREGVAKTADLLSPERFAEVFREATWDEALDRAAQGLASLRDTRGPASLAGFGSAKGSNEEAYLFQKLVRTGLRTNNVDHCTRLCHASSVAALIEGLGSAAVSNPVADVLHADFVLVIGANPSENHPVAATWIKNAAQRGTTLVVADPRRTALARHAQRWLGFRPDTDVVLLQALLNVIFAEGLVDERFVRERTSDVEALRASVAAMTPEAAAPICGIDAATLRDVARRYATARAAMILWGMGVSQHVHGTDNARCLIALALVTGQVGRPGTGLHPLRGQNNVQGASDAGLIPMVLPDYRRVDDAAARGFFERYWHALLDPTPGLTVVEITDAIRAGTIRGLYVMGENPAMSDPDAAHAREALARLDHLVVQDIFPTETAGFADVILPASSFYEKWGSFTNTDRTIQLARPVLEPPGEARADLAIVQQIAQRLGLDWRYAGPYHGVAAVFDEMRHAMPSIAGVTWDRLERDGAVTYPCT